MSQFFEDSLAKLRKEHGALIRRKNTKTSSNGVWTRYAYPVVTAGHTPLFWRYDLNPATNPRLLERFGINSAFNSGAIKLGGKYILVVREATGNPSSQWPRVTTEWITSASGRIR